jgi:iron(III) transport system permease protein
VLNGALLQIHPELEEVGYVSGLTVLSVLRRVFLPLVMPAVVGVWLWRVLITYRELTVATVLLTPNNITLPVVVWSEWIGIGLGPAADVTLIIVAALAPLIFLYWIIIGRRSLG